MKTFSKFDILNYYENKRINFEKLKQETIEKWAKYGLKDEELRSFYTEITPRQTLNQMCKKATSVFCSDEKFLSYLNSGLPTKNEPKTFYKNAITHVIKTTHPSFLHQAIMMQNNTKVEMLLAANTKFNNSPYNSQADTLACLVNFATYDTFALVAAFMEEVPENHWCFGAMFEQTKKGKSDLFYQAIVLADKLKDLGINEKEYVKKSVALFDELKKDGLLTEHKGVYKISCDPNVQQKTTEQKEEPKQPQQQECVRVR